MHTLIVAFGQVNARALAPRVLSPDWALVTAPENLRGSEPSNCDLHFCETARHLPQYDAIVAEARRRGFKVPTLCHEWGNHAATLSGAFELMEGIHGDRPLTDYCMRSGYSGTFRVYYGGDLILDKREDGQFRIAIKGECLACPK